MTKQPKIQTPVKKHLSFEERDVSLAEKFCKKHQMSFMDLMRKLLRDHVSSASDPIANLERSVQSLAQEVQELRKQLTENKF